MTAGALPEHGVRRRREPRVASAADRSLPGDKAVEIARQICAGLAAAHERGVLHRDLKPENVMLDGQGRVRLMDFGLAAIREELSADDLTSGTPAYMAPEQLEGRGVTARSDLYGLGLVLHEMFTGRQIFDAPTLADLKKQRQSFTPERASLTTIDADPAVEQVIRRCLETDPDLRPASALAVAMALPGGIRCTRRSRRRAALARDGRRGGGDRGDPPDARLIALGLLRRGARRDARLDTEPDRRRTRAGRARPRCARRSRAHRAARGGARGPVVDHALGFQTDREALNWLRDHGPKDDPYAAVTSLRLGATRFWYREAPRALARQPERRGHARHPSPVELSGAGGVSLDEAGRLMSLFVVPPQVPDPAPAPIPATDWKPIFDAAKLDLARFTATAPERLPTVFADARFAWRSAWPRPPTSRCRSKRRRFAGSQYFSRSSHRGAGRPRCTHWSSRCRSGSRRT